MRPNIFSYATSELSQDAFLCWLAAWAAPDCASEDPALHALGREFLATLLRLHGRTLPEITSLEVRRQQHRIDVLVRVNKTLAILIEDKVGTDEHSNQLERYVKAFEKEGFARENIVPVYVQTAEQPSYKRVEQAGYKVLRRPALIGVLQDYRASGGSYSIACDFLAYLEGIEASVASYRTGQVKAWSWYAWQGFFGALNEAVGDAGWGYVPNPTGGFQGFWWHWCPQPGCEPYLQLEEGRLVFKIMVKDAGQRGSLREAWHARVMKASRQAGLKVSKPTRFGTGETMTVAVLDGDYRVPSADGVLDIEATVARLREAQAVLDQAVELAK